MIEYRSAKKIRGLAQYLWMESHPVVNGKRTDVYTYLVPESLQEKAEKAGALEVKRRR